MILNLMKKPVILKKIINMIQIHQIQMMIGVQKLAKIRKRKYQLKEINER